MCISACMGILVEIDTGGGVCVSTKAFLCINLDHIHLDKPVGAYVYTYMGLYIGVHILYMYCFASKTRWINFAS